MLFLIQFNVVNINLLISTCSGTVEKAVEEVFYNECSLGSIGYV